MAPQNQAAWIKEKQAPVMVIEEAPYYKPEADELTIKTTAVAINPADYAIQQMGIIIDTYPAIGGCDVAGVVEEIGPNVTAFKPGDRVIAQAEPLVGGVYKYAAFQQYVVVRPNLVAKIPEHLEFSDAVVLPLGITTAASCIFEEDSLALSLPPSSAGNGKTLLVWGASSSVGSCGIQLAVAAGYEVIGIASKRNHEYVKSIGAASCFDQNEANLIETVCDALKGKDVVGAYDAISTENTLPTVCRILHQCGGRKVIAAVMPGAENLATEDVKIVTNFVQTASRNAVVLHAWRTFLEPALEADTFQCKPNADIVGHGLEDVQKACDLIGKGVSAKKLVVTLD